ncbi:lipopolysaccharide biosynthesis protein [Bacteroides sp.]|uniref:lipopolysaccharide biosynthesis protein n=1 Tax=Bacteroides sp. TaxID=29523 RepID=UPI00260EDDAD|nr:lipopolysaccharide biosynthesis protein [Bacteroides sp.]MDD3040480.1 lipopolysaccharide biosynthesis protein [Bacteroides sp.]
METNDNKRLAKNTLILYIRMFFTMGVSLYTSRVVLAILGVTDYGIYNVVGGVVAMFNIINNAMASSTQRFMTFELGTGDYERLQKVFSTSINIHALICVIMVLLAETIGLWFLNTQLIIPAERIVAANWVYQMSVLAACIGVMSVPYNAAIIAHEKMSAFAYFSVMDVTLKLLVVYLLMISPIDKLILYSILIFCVGLISRIVYGIYCSKNFVETKYTKVKYTPLFKEMLSFAGWGLFGNCSAFASTHGVNLLLNTFFSPAINAARGIAVQVQMAVQNFCSSFQIALNPQITKTYASNECDRMRSLICTSSRLSFFLVYLMVLPIVLEANEILSVWLKEVPEHTVNFLRIILCVSLIDTLANPIITAAGATGKIKKYQTVVGSINIMIIPISYIILRICPVPELVFVIHVLMALIAQGARIYLVRPMIELPLRMYIKKVVIRIVGTMIISSVLPVALYMTLPSMSIMSFLCIGFVSVFSALLSVFYIGLEQTERDFAILKIQNMLWKYSRK